MRLEIAQKNLLSDGFSLQRLKSNDDTFIIQQINANGWTIDPPATYVVEASQYVSATTFSLSITNTTESPTFLRAVEQSVEYPYIAETLIFHAMLYVAVATNVTAYLHRSDANYTTVSPTTVTLSAGQWSPIFSNEQLFGNDESATTLLSVTIIIDQASVDSIYLTLPTLTLAEPEKYNQIYQLSQPYFPDIFRDVDLESSNPSRPFAKIYHSMSADLSQAMDKYVRMTNFERSEINHGSVEISDSPYNILSRSELTDPSLMTQEYLEWGSMLRGSQILSDVQIDDTSILDSSFDFRRWQVQTAAFGHLAGSKSSIKATIKNLLTGNRTVLVTPLWEGNQFEIMIRTINDETPGNLTVGDSSSEILTLAEHTRPAGYVFLHETVEDFYFILNDPDFGVFDQNKIS